MNNPHAGQFCWSDLATPNVSLARDFYGKVLGWEFDDYEVEGNTCQ